MHRSRDIQLGIFEPKDWGYFQVLPSWARAETFQKTQFFIELSTEPNLKKKVKKNLHTIPFGDD
jgi:hypothetical protein